MAAIESDAQRTEHPSEQSTYCGDGVGPKLDQQEREQVRSRLPMSATTVHEVVRLEGEHELERSPSALAWSGVAAGLSMGFSLITQSLLVAYLPKAPWVPLVSSLGYSVGFLIVILGRQQLFTENTLTVILPLLTQPTRRNLGRVARLWGIVLAANLVGTCIIAAVLAHAALFPPAVEAALVEVAQHAFARDWGMTLLRGIFAGWLIALMVWLLPAAQSARVHIIIIATYVVSLGGFSHIIAGSVDVLLLANRGAISYWEYLGYFLAPTCLGNIIGGVTLVAFLNFAQVTTLKNPAA